MSHRISKSSSQSTPVLFYLFYVICVVFSTFFYFTILLSIIYLTEAPDKNCHNLKNYIAIFLLLFLLILKWNCSINILAYSDTKFSIRHVCTQQTSTRLKVFFFQLDYNHTHMNMLFFTHNITYRSLSLCSKFYV